MEPKAQIQEDDSTNSVVGVQPSNATDIESTEGSDLTIKTQVPQTSELSGEAKVVEPEDSVFDVLDEQSSGRGGGGESWRAEDGNSTPKAQVPLTPEEDCVIDHVKPDGQSSGSGGGGDGESWRAKDGNSTPKIQIPQSSELSGEEQEVKAVEPQEDCVIDVKPDGHSSGSGGGGDGESWRAEDGDSTPKTQIPQLSELSGEEQEVKAVEPEEGCIIDVKSDGQTSCGGGESWRGEKICRICHLSPENSSENSELIQLGCGCKSDLGFSHLHCAETWFKHKGNRQCEICGSIAKNIPGMQDTRIFMLEWNQARLTRRAADPSRSPCQCRNSTCNLLLACLVLAFVLPWFFRLNLS